MLDSKNVTEKDQKVKFLQAIIACTTLVYGKEITVKGTCFGFMRISVYLEIQDSDWSERLGQKRTKASSIVSGKEPENTNKLLQIIGKCILDKKSSDEAVEQLKNGGKKTEKESKPKEESRRKEKEPSQEKGMLCNLVFLQKNCSNQKFTDQNRSTNKDHLNFENLGPIRTDRSTDPPERRSLEQT